MVRKLLDKVDELIYLSEEPGWPESDRTGEYVVYSKQTESGLNWVKGQGPINAPANEIFDFILTDGNTPKYDKQFKSGHIIEELGLGINAKIEYSRYHGATFVSDRDFWTVSAGFQLLDDHFILIATSVVHPDCPEVRKVVRGDVYIGGFIITPDANDPLNRSYMHYINQVDPKGYIPKYLINKLAVDQGFVPKKVNKYLVNLRQQNM